MRQLFGEGEMARRTRALDWSATPLGPIADWSAALRVTVDTMLAMPIPAALVWGAEQTLIYNDAYVAIARDRHPALLGRPLAEGWSDIYAGRVAVRLAGVYAGRASAERAIAVPLRAATGVIETRIFDSAWTPLRDDDGAVRGALQMLTEVTTDAHAQQKLRDSEARLRALVTAGRFTPSRISPDWRRFHDLDGQPYAGVGEDWMEQLVHEDDRAELAETIARGTATRSMFELEHRLIRADGAIAHIASRAVPILDDGGEIVEWLACAIDVTARRTAEGIARHAEEQRRIALDSGGMGTWRVDLDTLLVDGDARFHAFYGMAPDTPARPLADFTALLSADSAAQVDAVLRASLLPDAEVDGELEVAAGVTAGTWLRWRGRVSGGARPMLHGVLFDVTQQRQALAALRESEAHMRQFGDASHDVLWIRDATTLQWRHLTPAFETVFGIDRAVALEGDHYRNWIEMIVAADRPQAEAAIERVRAGEHVTFDYRIRRPSDGQIRWLRNTDFPIRDGRERIVRIGGIVKDVTASRMAREAVARNEERLRSAVQVGGVGLWDWNIATGEMHWSDDHFLMHGYPVGEVVPGYAQWLERVHPDDRAAAEEAVARAMAQREEYVHEFRVVHPGGDLHWHYARGRFFYDEAGVAVRMIGAMVDVTERREWAERQQVLIAELQHRTRNLIGVVQSVADKTARASHDLADFDRRFRDRLEALARVQGLMSRLGDCDRVAFDQLIAVELTAMDADPLRVRLAGPRGVRLRSSTLQLLAMALHELATNAVKYGALGQAEARLAITWRLERATDQEGARPLLHIDWRESGVAMPGPGTAPAGSGQGRELIERALPYQLGAETTFSLEADGVHCTIVIPASATTDEG